jgi:hypothetical protein
MPILKRRYNREKYYRPNGARYAHGASQGGTIRGMWDAYAQAVENFHIEFNTSIKRPVIDIEFDPHKRIYVVTVYDIPLCYPVKYEK